MFLFETDLYQNQHYFHFFKDFCKKLEHFDEFIILSMQNIWVFFSSRNTTLNRLLDIILIYKLTVNVIFLTGKGCV